MSDSHDRSARESADTIPVESDPHATQPEVEPSEGAFGDRKFGRFTVLDRLGVGGMGVVVSAYDPQLDRKVAIKVLRGQGLTGERHAKEAARLLREAKALAQLSHPNVITVYDAGAIDDRVFIAMEYVSGRTLRAWLAEAKRTVPEILDVFVKAGRGLAAGHHAGLIHRDFKPDNVLIGLDGRVRVIDFGLARPARAQADTDPIEPAAELTTSSQLTTARGVFGTPIYMAPEQHENGELDSRTDQFAFCIALFDALFGRLPFPVESYPLLVVAVTTGKIEAPQVNADVPRRVVDAVLRGLRPDPDDRFPSMDRLLDELEPPARRRRGLAIASMALGAAAAVAITLGVVYVRSDRSVDPCAGGQERFAGVWDAPTKDRIKAALLASHRTHAPETFKRLAETLDRHVATWLARRHEVCEATKVRNEQSDTAFDLRMQCLARQLAELQALTALFANADVATTDNAVLAATSLPDPATCLTLTLGAVAPPNTVQSALLDPLWHELAEIRANVGARKDAIALAKAEALIARAHHVGYAPFEADVQFWLGVAQRGASKPAEAERTLRDALAIAARAKDDPLSAQIWTMLISVVGHQLARYGDALALRPYAENAIQRADDNPVLRSNLAYHVATVYFTQGEYQRANELYESALALRSADEGPDLANILNALGGSHLRLGNLLAAKASFEKALAMLERTVGPAHPDIAIPLANLGALSQALGMFDEATASQERALKILEEVHGPDGVNVGLTVYSLAVSANGREDYRGAIPYYERALGIFEKIGPDHPYVGLALVGLADCREEVGDAARSVPEAERGLQLVAKGTDPIQLALARYVLAKALWAADRERPRALALGAEARKGFAAGGVASLNGLIAVDNWFKKINAKP